MEMYKFRYILTIAEEQGITRACSKLYLSQPYLSKVLSDLEKSLNTKLFNRTKTSMELTKSGERYIRYVKDILQIEEEMKQDIEEINSRKRSKLIIGISPTRGAYILPYIISNFEKKYPYIDIILEEKSSPNILDEIISKKIDIGFLSLPDCPDDIEYEVAKKEKILLVLPAGHPLGSNEAKGNYMDPVSIDKKYLKHLEKDRFILTKKNQGLGIIARRFLTENKLYGCSLMETINLDTAYRLAVSGVGFTLIPQSCIRSKQAENEPYYYTIATRTLEWITTIAYRKDLHINESLKDFIDISKLALRSI